MKQLSNALFGLCFAATTVLATSTPTLSQTTARNCAERNLVLSKLAERYGETRQSIGLGKNNAVVEIFASDETGTWTITVTMPNGTTCMIASGQAFEQLANEELAVNEQDT